MTHICVGKLTIIGSDNGLSPGRHQAIIWTNAGILLIEPLGTNFSEILIGIHKFSFTKMRLKMSSAKWRPFCFGLNVLIRPQRKCHIVDVQNVHSPPLVHMAWCPAARNSLWPSDAIWRHRSGSTLAQVMACCLTAPTHYLNQCWLIISKIQLHSSNGNFTRATSVSND